jgi:hypothetical protein
MHSSRWSARRRAATLCLRRSGYLHRHGSGVLRCDSYSAQTADNWRSQIPRVSAAIRICPLTAMKQTPWPSQSVTGFDSRRTATVPRTPNRVPLRAQRLRPAAGRGTASSQPGLGGCYRGFRPSGRASSFCSAVCAVAEVYGPTATNEAISAATSPGVSVTGGSCLGRSRR